MTPEERARYEAERVARAAEQAALRKERKRRFRKVTRFVHGPYGSKECGRCHDLGRASSFRVQGAAAAVGPASEEDLAEGGRLRLPVVQLCTHCHDDFAREAPGNEGLWLHGPVASGWCVLCHAPHSSDYPRLLHALPTARLCGQCHLREDLVAATPDHLPRSDADAYPPVAAATDGEGNEAPESVVRVAKSCIRCHDPHRGPDSRVLKEGWQQALQAPPPSPAAPNGAGP